MLDIIKNNAALLVEALQLVTKVLNWWVLGIVLIVYILLALGLYKQAKNRALDHPWLAWLPIGNLWILGCLADQYRKLVLGKEKANHANRLFWVSLVAAVLLIAVVVLTVSGLSYITENAPNMSLEGERLEEVKGLTGDDLTRAYLELMADMIAKDELLAQTVTGGLIALTVLSCLLIAANIYLVVEKYIALYYFFDSSVQKHKVWMLALSILLGADGIFVFICRNQNQAMPHDKKGRIKIY